MSNRKMKRVFTFLLSTALTLQSMPLTVLAAPENRLLKPKPITNMSVTGSNTALVKTPGYQNFPTYYQDNNHVDGQVTHPDVAVMEEPWNGYRYWAVYTPNVMRTSKYENPSIVASEDGVNWVEPDGLTNPIEPQPPSERYHNCDADLVYNPNMDAMMAYWNWADDQSGGVGAEVRIRISYDGISWGIPVTYDKETNIWEMPDNESERQVTSGPSDFITAVKSKQRYDMLSQTINYDSYRDTFVMWANNATDVGYQNGQKNHVRMWYSKDGINWGAPLKVNNFLDKDENGKQLAPWHQDISYVEELKEYWGLSQCFSGSNPDGSVLYFTKSKDGVNWQQVGHQSILSPGQTGSWDDFQIYRSCFYYEPDSSNEMGEGNLKVWYSALQKDTNGKMIPDSEGNLTIQAGSHDDRIWRIGYAENKYTDMMKVLTGDQDYSVPALVAGESLDLTPDVSGNTISVGQKVQLTPAFTPSDTSDQIVKYTSSNPSVAVVDDYGIIKAIKGGQVKITGETRDGLTKSLDYSIAYVPVTGLTLNVEDELSVFGGASIQLTGTIAPENASNKTITWTSSDSNVAAITDTGLITGLSGGSAVITAAASDGINRQIQVTVTDNPSEQIEQSRLTATATSSYNGTTEGPASNVVDGDKSTIWHTNYNPKDPLPQSLTVSLNRVAQLNRFVYTPRQNGDNGTVTKYELYAVKPDGSKQKIAEGQWNLDKTDKTVAFAPVEATGIELKVLEGYGGFGTAAEINLYKLEGSGDADILPQSIQLRSNMAVSVGDSSSISASVLPAGADQSISFTSSDPEIASVNGKVVTGKKEGTAAITAASAVSPEITAECLVTVSASDSQKMYGNGVSVAFDNITNKVKLNLIDEDGAEIPMSKNSVLGYPKVDDNPVNDFTNFNCIVEESVEGKLGTGNRMTITSESASTGLLRTHVLETFEDDDGLIYTTTFYQAGDNEVNVTEFVENIFELSDPGKTVWSYNGGGEGAQSWYDTLQKIDLTDSKKFTRENIQDYTSAGIPVSDIYTEQGGITVGDASATRREVRTPVEETSNSAQVSIIWPGKTIPAGSEEEIGQSFVNVHTSDYYMGLKGFAAGMARLGVKAKDQSEIPESSYDLRWESWGWEFDWSIDLILGKLDELQEIGIKQVTLDDGWYNNAGEWGLNTNKLPLGDEDMRRITDAIHERGMTAILWWRPCDGGRESSKLYKEHPDYFIKNENGSFGKLAGPGQYNSFLGSSGYALCPSSEGAVASQVDFVNRAMNDWGFDGFKGDYVWSLPKCYNEAHNHAYPEESTEQQSKFYEAAHAAMAENNPDFFALLCNCGTPQDYYSIPYMTQIATADPTSVDQTRRRVKAYKALAGDYFPITTDHNEIWYPSTIGTGSVLIEKRNFNESQQAEYEKWLTIAQDVQLQKGRFVGDLYNYGFDPYETYVVEKDGVMFYAFYKDGAKYKPSGNPEIELKGLDSSKMYRIVDYVNNKVVATNLMGDQALFTYDFKDYLLLKAVEITTPDEDLPEDGTFISVDAMDSALKYKGTWTDDHNEAFYQGNARNTSAEDASVSFTFKGTGVRWHGQTDSNYGTAAVYIDDELIETVDLSGMPAVDQQHFEILDLPYGEHTIKVVCETPVIDIDRFSYTTEVREDNFISEGALSDKLTYTGSWVSEDGADFYEGHSKYTSNANASVEMTFVGTGVRWYGQKDTNFGTADVYIDGVRKETVNCNGSAAVQQMHYEIIGLPNQEHTIKVVCKTPTIDIDRFAYLADGEQTEVSKDEIASALEVADSYLMEDFKESSYKDQFNVSLNRAHQLMENEDATQSSIDAELEYLVNAMLELRRIVDLEAMPDGSTVIPSVSGTKVSKKLLNKILNYAEKTKIQEASEKLMPEVKVLWDEKLSYAVTVDEDLAAAQNDINTAWAELLCVIQYLDYKEDTKKPEEPTVEVPEEIKPDDGKLDETKPGTEQPDADTPDTEQPDTEQPDTDKPDSEKPDSDKPDSDKPDSEKPDTEKPDNEKPNSEKPDTGEPDSEKPDTEKPDNGNPDTDTSDTIKPDNGKPDSDLPNAGTPDTNSPDIENPELAAPGSDKPAADTPVMLKRLQVNHSRTSRL